MSGLFYDAWNFLIQTGFIDIVVPMILVYALVYAILDRTKIVGDLEKDPQAASRAGVISLSVALIFTATRYAVIALKFYLPYILLFGIMAFFIMVVIAAILLYTQEDASKGLQKLDRKIAYLIVGITLFAIVMFILYYTGLLSLLLSASSNGPGFSIPPELINVAITFGIMILIVMWTTGYTPKIGSKQSSSGNTTKSSNKGGSS